MLQLRHVFLHRRFLGERPGQHELGLEHGLTALNPPIERGAIQRSIGWRMCRWTSVITCPVLASYQRRLRSSVTDPELDDQIAGQVLWLDLAALFLPEPDERFLIITHDDPGVRAADEMATIAG